MTAQGKEFGGTRCSVEQGRKVFPASGSPSAKTIPGAHLDAGRTLARQQTLLHCLMSFSPPLIAGNTQCTFGNWSKDKTTQNHLLLVSSSVFFLLYSPRGAGCGFKRISVLANDRLSSSRMFG